MPVLVIVAVVAGLIALWHLAIFVATLVAPVAMRKHMRPDPPQIAGIHNFRVVDDHVWRGGRPSIDAYRILAEYGVATIVDLREEMSAPAVQLDALGLDVAHVPIVDGTLPTGDQVKQALAAIDGSAGLTFVHCAAGVGRTGSIVACHLLADASASRWQVLARNLEVGPPSLEQIAFAFTAPKRPHAAVVLLSRLLDAPRVYFGKARQWLRSLR